MLLDPKISVLGNDPTSTSHRINCNSFQQDAVVSDGGWGYAAFYSDADIHTEAAASSRAAADMDMNMKTNMDRKTKTKTNVDTSVDSTSSSGTGAGTGTETAETTPHLAASGDADADADANVGRYITIARRLLPSHPTQTTGQWEFLTLKDYLQTADDGHNTISLGVCAGDGTVHVAFDAHCDGLRYRVSKPVAHPHTHTEMVKWDEAGTGFSRVLDNLPGLSREEGMLLREITYPRFVSVDGGELLFECRVGMAGRGSCMLFRYAAVHGMWRWRVLGGYLVGEGCSPYVNGVSFQPAGGAEGHAGEKEVRLKHQGKIHVTWTNRQFVEYEDHTGEAHKRQAGPNGPENNADLGYVYSDDGGVSWRDVQGDVVGELSGDGMHGVISTGEKVLVARIPRDSEIMNQEGQAVDCVNGILHVLMRDCRLRGGGCRWRHSWWVPRGGYQHSVIEEESVIPTATGKRGKVAVDERNGDVYFVLPGNMDDTLLVGRKRIVGGRQDGRFGEFEVVWRGKGYDGEPLIDEKLFRERGWLSVMTRTSGQARKVVVLDIRIDAV